MGLLRMLEDGFGSDQDAEIEQSEAAVAPAGTGETTQGIWGKCKSYQYRGKLKPSGCREFGETHTRGTGKTTQIVWVYGGNEATTQIFLVTGNNTNLPMRNTVREHKFTLVYTGNISGYPEITNKTNSPLYVQEYGVTAVTTQTNAIDTLRKSMS